MEGKRTSKSHKLLFVLVLLCKNVRSHPLFALKAFFNVKRMRKHLKTPTATDDGHFIPKTMPPQSNLQANVMNDGRLLLLLFLTTT